MSAEEKAVRDALAAVQADTGIQQANQALGISTPEPKTTATGGISEIADPAWRAMLERLTGVTDTLQGRVATDAENLGYNYNPITGTVTPKTSTNTSGQQDQNKTPVKDLPPSITYDTISKILESYGITGLAAELSKIRQEYPEANSSDLMTLLQFDPRYNAKFNERFSANADRQKAGLPVLSPATYLAMEQGYKKTLSQYNLTKFNNQSYYNKLIAGDVAVTELSDRVTLAYDRVLNDIQVSNAFNRFFPALTVTDIVTGMLDPVNQLPELERKVKAAEVGGAALRQNLAATELASTEDQSKVGYSNVTRGTLGADVLAQQGVTKTQAEAGFAKVAEVLPTAEKLSSIYGNTLDQYGRLQAEQEVFQGLASAKRAREKLTATEVATFGGSSGVSQSSLKRKTQGQF